MNNNNASTTTLSFSNSFLKPVILDWLGIGISIIAICKMTFMILLIFARRQLIKPKERVLFLLSLNMFMNVLIFACFTLNMFISMLLGHMNPDRTDLHDNTLRCRLKIYVSTIALISALYSNTLQALHRLFRIVYHHRPFFYRNIYLYMFGIVVEIHLGALLQLPVLLPGHYDYEDYHCQVYLTNWRGILIGASCVWLPPVILTIIIYVCTVSFIRRNLSKFTMRQKKRIKRDFIVIRRILWLVVFIILFGTPACSTPIVYHLFGYIGWWANHITWLTFISSFTGMTVVHTYYAPHLHVLLAKSFNCRKLETMV
ncbi:unnamed protein product [Adineta ricciae]|uniref:G-protein coupled receptors family 1 profile domain-containing protein n=1 Tax=Adineta ricciae TaxID=249248 RepID=A0A814M1Q2_ADIRI|nr:unnamed protein product [Adineta ricciae]CAF1124599.1 unnamed protein product [Adineta ricciae]